MEVVAEGARPGNHGRDVYSLAPEETATGALNEGISLRSILPVTRSRQDGKAYIPDLELFSIS